MNETPRGPARLARTLRGQPIALLLLALTSWACGADSAKRPARDNFDLESVVVPGLDRLEPRVQQSITAALREVERLEADSNSPPEDLGSAYGRLGQVLHAYELNRQALAAYANASRLLVDDPRWPHYRGRLLHQAGELQEATEALERASALAPRSIPTLVAQARVQKDLLQFEAAEQTARSALSIDSEDASILLVLAELEMDRGNPTAAIEWYELLLHLQPQATRLYEPLAAAYRATGDADRASTALARSGDGTLILVDPPMQQLGSMRSDPQFHMNEGIAAFNRGDFATAATEFRKAAEAVPDDPVPWTNLGSALARQGDLDGATNAFTRALAIAPRDASAHFNLGILALRRNDEAVAEAHYRKALESEPRHKGARFNLANLLRRQGRTEEALEGFSALLGQDPGNDQARLAVVTCLVDLNRPSEALRLVQEGLASDPDSPTLLSAGARLLACSPEEALRDGHQAGLWAEELLQTSVSVQNLETMAMAMAASERFEESLALQRRAIELATQSNQPELLPRLRTNLERYHRREPCEDSALGS